MAKLKSVPPGNWCQALPTEYRQGTFPIHPVQLLRGLHTGVIFSVSAPPCILLILTPSLGKLLLALSDDTHCRQKLLVILQKANSGEYLSISSIVFGLSAKEMNFKHTWNHKRHTKSSSAQSKKSCNTIKPQVMNMQCTKSAMSKQRLSSSLGVEVHGIDLQPERKARHSNHSRKRYPDGDSLRGSALVGLYSSFTLMIPA